MTRHRGPKECRFCKRVFVNFRAMTQHVDEIHPNGHRPVATVKCPLCEREFRNEHALKDHLSDIAEHTPYNDFVAQRKRRRQELLEALKESGVSLEELNGRRIQERKVARVGTRNFIISFDANGNEMVKCFTTNDCESVATVTEPAVTASEGLWRDLRDRDRDLDIASKSGSKTAAASHKNDMNVDDASSYHTAASFNKDIHQLIENDEDDISVIAYASEHTYSVASSSHSDSAEQDEEFEWDFDSVAPTAECYCKYCKRHYVPEDDLVMHTCTTDDEEDGGVNLDPS